jgi:hypothetical protein
LRLSDSEIAQKSAPSGAPRRAAAASIAVMPGSTRMSRSRQCAGPCSTASNTAAAMANTPGSPPETTATCRPATARLGAPLGADFCAISLSDNLKPWDVVTARLEAVLRAGEDDRRRSRQNLGRERQRPAELPRPRGGNRIVEGGRALALAAEILPATTPVIFARAVTRPDEALRVLTLDEARTAPASRSISRVVAAPMMIMVAISAGAVRASSRVSTRNASSSTRRGASRSDADTSAAYSYNRRMCCSEVQVPESGALQAFSTMLKGGLLWLIGIPLPIILLLWFFNVF